MKEITLEMKEALIDLKNQEGLTNAEIGKRIGVTGKTIGCYFKGETTTMQDEAWMRTRRLLRGYLKEWEGSVIGEPEPIYADIIDLMADKVRKGGPELQFKFLRFMEEAGFKDEVDAFMAEMPSRGSFIIGYRVEGYPLTFDIHPVDEFEKEN